MCQQAESSLGGWWLAVVSCGGKRQAARLAALNELLPFAAGRRFGDPSCSRLGCPRLGFTRHLQQHRRRQLSAHSQHAHMENGRGGGAVPLELTPSPLSSQMGSSPPPTHLHPPQATGTTAPSADKVTPSSPCHTLRLAPLTSSAPAPTSHPRGVPTQSIPPLLEA